MKRYRKIYIGEEEYRLAKSEAALCGMKFIDYVNKKIKNDTKKKRTDYDIKW